MDALPRASHKPNGRDQQAAKSSTQQGFQNEDRIWNCTAEPPFASTAWSTSTSSRGCLCPAVTMQDEIRCPGEVLLVDLRTPGPGTTSSLVAEMPCWHTLESSLKNSCTSCTGPEGTSRPYWPWPASPAAPFQSSVMAPVSAWAVP